MQEKRFQVQAILDKIFSEIDRGAMDLKITKKNAEYINKTGLLPNQIIGELRKSLCVDDYMTGPTKHHLPNIKGSVWEFGQKIEDIEMYVKILYYPSSGLIMSYHFSEQKNKYYFK